MENNTGSVLARLDLASTGGGESLRLFQAYSNAVRVARQRIKRQLAGA